MCVFKFHTANTLKNVSGRIKELGLLAVVVVVEVVVVIAVVVAVVVILVFLPEETRNISQWALAKSHAK